MKKTVSSSIPSALTSKNILKIHVENNIRKFRKVVQKILKKLFGRKFGENDTKKLEKMNQDNGTKLLYIGVGNGSKST